MRAPSKPFGRWLACALAGVLVAYLYGVFRAEPAVHDGSLSAWQWFWQSYGSFFRRGLLIGGVAGVALAWLLPRVLGQRRGA